LTIELTPRRKQPCSYLAASNHSMHISACAPHGVRSPLTHSI
jgi:hypothetical protein